MTDEAKPEETEETSEVEETVDVKPEDDEPPAWFKSYLTKQEEARQAAEKKTVAKPTKTAPAKKQAPTKPAPVADTEETPARKRGGVSRSWFGNRAD